MVKKLTYLFGSFLLGMVMTANAFALNTFPTEINIYVNNQTAFPIEFRFMQDLFPALAVKAHAVGNTKLQAAKANYSIPAWLYNTATNVPCGVFMFYNTKEYIDLYNGKPNECNFIVTASQPKDPNDASYTLVIKQK